MIRVVDYGVGNIQAFLNMFKRLDLPAERARTPQDLMDAKHLILPGVGAFDTAMRKLNDSGLRQPLEHLVLQQQVPVLGVCVGMQMLAVLGGDVQERRLVERRERAAKRRAMVHEGRIGDEGRA